MGCKDAKKTLEIKFALESSENEVFGVFEGKVLTYIDCNANFRTEKTLKKLQLKKLTKLNF
jgi:hypothetical protein